MVTVDSYSETNQNEDAYMGDLHPSDSVYISSYGQSFLNADSNRVITSAKFYLKKGGNPTGDMHAVLYAHSGTYGTNSLPTGAALATSDAVAAASLGAAYALITFTFTGAQQYEMQADTYYVIQCENPQSGTINTSNYPIVGRDGSTPTHGGNASSYKNSAWVVEATKDTCFYVFSEPAGGGVTVKKGSTVASTMTTMLNSKMLFSICNRFPPLNPRRF